MRIICDAPGQTCNRLWTYVTSVARCVAEKKKMAIIFFDWTIEDFPNLLHCKFIYFPLYHRWFLKTKKGWGRYKQLTWTVTHNKVWDKLFHFFGCKKGWNLMSDTRYLVQTKKELQYIFRPRQDIVDRAEAMIADIRREAALVVGVHIRHGDYREFHQGRHFYSLEEFHEIMQKIEKMYPDKQVAFFISSNELFSTDVFPGCKCFRFYKEPSGDILDLHTLSLCDLLVGPWSTYSRWASFIGEVPLCCLKGKQKVFTKDNFSVITDFYHFANGENTEKFWLDYAYFRIDDKDLWP